MNVAAARQRRRAFENATTMLFIIAAIPLFFLTLPITLPYLAVSEALNKRRMREAAERTPCEKCGCLLTRKALESAKERASAEAAELRTKYPNIMFRRKASTVWAICTTCLAEYNWNDREKTFVLNAAGDNVSHV